MDTTTSIPGHAPERELPRDPSHDVTVQPRARGRRIRDRERRIDPPAADSSNDRAEAA